MAMQHKRLNIQDNAIGLKPKVAAVEVGELAINFNDARLWTKTNENAIIELGGEAGALRDADYAFTGSFKVDDVSIDGNTITSKIKDAETDRDLVIASEGAASKVQFTGATQFEENSTFKKDLTVEGDLFVTGEINSVNSNVLNVQDSTIILNSGDGTAATANGAGISVQIAPAVGATPAILEDILEYQRTTDGNEKRIVVLEKDAGETEVVSQIATRAYVTAELSASVAGEEMALSDWA